MCTTTPTLWSPGDQTQAFVQTSQAPNQLSHVLHDRSWCAGFNCPHFSDEKVEAVWYSPLPNIQVLFPVCPAPYSASYNLPTSLTTNQHIFQSQ